ncbi:MAG: AbrB/MazE/SpoVT family DNA-binding domain-containing protein [Desulfovermiculus sp.]|nr:AbrB/MazE/SpoVT family DNA-binding domain-containing protein [Desulfovermiculus sp.]
MPAATVTSKGQITIPKSIRDDMKIQEGDKLDFSLNEEGDIIISLVKKKVDDVFGLLYRPEQTPITMEEMDEAIARRMMS